MHRRRGSVFSDGLLGSRDPVIADVRRTEDDH